MSEDHLSAPLDPSEVDAQASAMLQRWQDRQKHICYKNICSLAARGCLDESNSSKIAYGNSDTGKESKGHSILYQTHLWSNCKSTGDEYSNAGGSKPHKVFYLRAFSMFTFHIQKEKLSNIFFSFL